MGGILKKIKSTGIYRILFIKQVLGQDYTQRFKEANILRLKISRLKLHRLKLSRRKASWLMRSGLRLSGLRQRPMLQGLRLTGPGGRGGGSKKLYTPLRVVKN